MKSLLIFVSLFVSWNAIHSLKLLASSSRELNRREMNRVKRLVKRQILSDPTCHRHECPPINCGKDFVTAALPGECCERCVPWEYASSLGIPYPPQVSLGQPRTTVFSPTEQRVDVYIFGPETGARVSPGQRIYFDCEIVSPFQQYAQPRWTRAFNQPLAYKVQSVSLAGSRKLVRLTIPDASPSDAGRYECSAATGNPNDFASIDLQVTDSPSSPRPSPPHYPPSNPFRPYPNNSPASSSSPPPSPPAPGVNIGEEDEETDDIDDEEEPSADPTTSPTITTTTTTSAAAAAAAPSTPSAQTNENGTEDEGEYPEDYSETE